MVLPLHGLDESTVNQGGKGVEGKGRAEFNVHMRFPSPETVKDDPEILTKPV